MISFNLQVLHGISFDQLILEDTTPKNTSIKLYQVYTNKRGEIPSKEEGNE